MKAIFLPVLSLCLMAFVLTASAPAHEFHVSKGQIEYVASEKSLQITLHLFIDDLEEALRRSGAERVFLGTDREIARADEYLQAYLKRHFVLTVNGQPVSYSFVGKEMSTDLLGMWCYLQVDGVDAPRQIKVRNDLLLDVFDDQKNILNIVGPAGKRSTLLFEKDNVAQQANF